MQRMFKKDYKKMIDRFEGEYFFMSNFSNYVVDYDGKVWKTSEHAFQAAKTNIKEEKDLIFSVKSPSQAKTLGGLALMREDWKEVRQKVMYEIVKNKFTQHPELTEKLLKTGNSYLEEGNNWHDTRWGVCYCRLHNGKGHNWLGDILMTVRKELSEIEENRPSLCE